MVGRLLAQRIEVSRAQNAITLNEGHFPAGTYVVRLDQPYRNYAVDLLSPQVFPRDKGEPYDDVSWEFPANSIWPPSPPRMRRFDLRGWRR